MAQGDVEVKITADSSEAERSLDGFKGKLEGAVGTVGKVAAAAAAAAAAAVGAVAGMALDAYADFEQLEGGVETLFGSSSQAVMDNAAQAFQTAGISANEYMEQATSTSAAMIQSLGGDTEEAARLTDQAILDMADNANKMGTDIGRIQDAYQGFSRGNFTMLDNLKLGYGGTRSEMERLLEDAEAISGVHYDIENYSDIVEAIHVIQTEMEITGTTAEEAASTIQGSIGMAKAAWQNWLTGIADEDADLGALTDQLLDAIETVAENVAPRLAIIGERIMAALPAVAADIASRVPGLFAEFVGPMLDGVSQMINDNLGTHLDIVGGLGDMFATLSETMAGPLSFLGQVFGDLVSFIGPLVDTWLPILGDLFANVIAPAAAVSASVLLAVVNAVMVVLIAIGQFVSAVQSYFSRIPGIIQGAISWFAQLPGQIAGFLAGVIATVAAWVSNMASSASNAARTFASNLISGIQSLPSRVASIGSQIVQGIARGITGAAGAVVNALGNVVQSAINAAKRRLGIASPSKVFATEVGQWIPKGAAAGILAAADSFYDAVDEVMGYMPDVGGYALDGGDMTPAASAGGLTVVVDGLAVNDLVGIRDTVVDFAYALAGRV